MTRTAIKLAFAFAALVATAYLDSARAAECDGPTYWSHEVAAICTHSGGGGATVDPEPTTNGSSTITTGGTFQLIAALNTARKSFEFQNKCDVSGNCVATTDNCRLFITSGTPATATSILLAPHDFYSRYSGTIPSGAIYATCDGTGDVFYESEQ